MLLELNKVCAGYNDLKVLFDIDLHLEVGEVVALVGSNGAGKTTLLRIISGEVKPTSGSLMWDEKKINDVPENARADMGIVHIPQGRGVLSSLSVKDNLFLGGYCKRCRPKRKENLDIVLETFPILRERLNLPAGTLSGGQQQMLAMGRAIMMMPKLFILDEPSLGLAPIVVNEVYDILANLKKAGTSMLIIEQNLFKALNIADRGYVLETGRIVSSGPSYELLENENIKAAYLGI